MLKRNVKSFKIFVKFCGIFIAILILIILFKKIQRNINQSLFDFYDKNKVETTFEITEKFSAKEVSEKLNLYEKM